MVIVIGHRTNLLFYNTFRNNHPISPDADEIDTLVQAVHVDDRLVRRHNQLSYKIKDFNRLQVFGLHRQSVFDGIGI